MRPVKDIRLGKDIDGNYIKFNAKVVWHQFVWDILMKQYDKDNPGNKDVYHLRAFDYYGIQPGMLVGDGEVEGN